MIRKVTLLGAFQLLVKVYTIVRVQVTKDAVTSPHLPRFASPTGKDSRPLEERSKRSWWREVPLDMVLEAFSIQ